MRRFRINPCSDQFLKETSGVEDLSIGAAPRAAADRGQRIRGIEDRRGERATRDRRVQRSERVDRQAREPILAPDQTAIKKLGAEITQLQDKFNKDGDVMSDPEKRKLQKEIEDKQIDYQFRVNKFQKTVNERQQDILSQMAPKLDAVLKDIIAKDQYDLVIHRQNILYVDAKYDITAQVTEKLNQKK